MYDVCVFAGTLDGRRLIEFLLRQGVKVWACVASEYGETLLEPDENLKISAGRMDEEKMRQLMEEERFGLVIDATHPYAVNVTETVFAACRKSGTEYLRLLRENSKLPGSAHFAENIEKAVELLNTLPGNILLATGSRDIRKYTGITDFENRVYARVLPMEESLRLCAGAGMKPSHIIAMQGPFSSRMNSACLRFASASWLVTKDGGDVGGFEEKAEAAKEAGAGLVVIGRPADREGLGYSEMLSELCRRFGLHPKPEVIIGGIGMGSKESMSLEMCEAIENADCLIGAERMLKAAEADLKPHFCASSPQLIADYIKEHMEYGRFCVLMSGDSGFYSGTKKLIPLLSNCNIRLIPGISSLSYLCSRLKISYEDVYCLSLHGREENIIEAVRRNEKVFCLLGGSDGVKKLCEKLLAGGLDDVVIHVGQRLGYEEEKISRGRPAELIEKDFHSLSAALIENKNAEGDFTPGLPDSEFIRNLPGEKTVPMTKSELRALCLSKLRLKDNSVCWDIGAGTGSVSVEMALKAFKGRVYAVEKNPEAVRLIEKNRDKFSLSNLLIKEGTAPEALNELPAPDRAFIGGSSGNVEEIISFLLEKNPDVRIVAAAISLETVSQLSNCLKSFKFKDSQVVALNVSRAKKLGAYNLMESENPVYLFSFGGGREL